MEELANVRLHHRGKPKEYALHGLNDLMLNVPVFAGVACCPCHTSEPGHHQGT